MSELVRLFSGAAVFSLFWTMVVVFCAPNRTPSEILAILLFGFVAGVLVNLAIRARSRKWEFLAD
jgi:hypothetical protein